MVAASGMATPPPLAPFDLPTRDTSPETVGPMSPLSPAVPMDNKEAFWKDLTARMKQIRQWRVELEQQEAFEQQMAEGTANPGGTTSPTSRTLSDTSDAATPITATAALRQDERLAVVAELEAVVKTVSDRYHDDTRRIFQRNLQNESRLRRRGDMVTKQLRESREAERRAKQEVAQLNRKIAVLKDDTVRDIKIAIVKQMGDQSDQQKLRAMKAKIMANPAQEKEDVDLLGMCSNCYEKLAPAHTQVTDSSRLRQVQNRCDLLAELSSLHEHHIMVLQERLAAFEGMQPKAEVMSPALRGRRLQSGFARGSPQGGSMRNPRRKSLSSQKEAVRAMRACVVEIREGLDALRCDTLDFHSESNSAILRSQWLVNRAQELLVPGGAQAAAATPAYQTPPPSHLTPAAGANSAQRQPYATPPTESLPGPGSPSGSGTAGELETITALRLADSADDPNLPYAYDIRVIAGIDNQVNEAAIRKGLCDELGVTNCVVIDSKPAAGFASPPGRANEDKLFYAFDIRLEGGAREVSRAACRLRSQEPLMTALPWLASKVETVTDTIYFDAVKKASTAAGPAANGAPLRLPGATRRAIRASLASASLQQGAANKRINRPVLARTGLISVVAMAVGVYKMFCMQPGRGVGAAGGTGTAFAAGGAAALALAHVEAQTEPSITGIQPPQPLTALLPTDPPQAIPTLAEVTAAKANAAKKKGAHGGRGGGDADAEAAAGGKDGGDGAGGSGGAGGLGKSKAFAPPPKPAPPKPWANASKKAGGGGKARTKTRAGAGRGAGRATSVTDAAVLGLERLKKIAAGDGDGGDGGQLWDWVASWRGAMEYYMETRGKKRSRSISIHSAAMFDDADQHQLLEELNVGDRVRVVEDPDALEELVLRHKYLTWDKRVCGVCGLVGTVVNYYAPEHLYRVKTVRGEVTLPPGSMELLTEASFRNDPIGRITLEVEWLQHDLRMRELALQSALYGKVNAEQVRGVGATHDQYDIAPGGIPLFAFGRSPPNVVSEPLKYDCSVQTEETRMERVVLGNPHRGDYWFVPELEEDVQYARGFQEEWKAATLLGGHTSGVGGVSPASVTAASAATAATATAAGSPLFPKTPAGGNNGRGTARGSRLHTKSRVAGSSCELDAAGLNINKRLLEQYSAASRLATANTTCTSMGGDDAMMCLPPRAPTTGAARVDLESVGTARYGLHPPGTAGSFPSLSASPLSTRGAARVPESRDSALAPNPSDPRPTTTSLASAFSNCLPVI